MTILAFQALRAHHPFALFARIGLLASTLLIAQCQAPGGASGLRLNEIQMLGSHNSYKRPIDEVVMAQLASQSPETARALDYSHRPIGEQLDLGLRKLELDVFYDPEGGRFASPMGANLPGATPYDPSRVMKQPGFKAFHVQDIDFRSHCLTFAACLTSVRDFSDRNPGHLPIFITINAKDAVIDEPGFTTPLPFDADAWHALDDEIRGVLGDRLLTPDDVRGDAPTLRAGVLRGWPPLDAVRGRVLFVLDDSAQKKAAYSAGHPSLSGRAMFIDAPVSSPEAAIFIINDPVQRRAEIRARVETGFIVRTRADADTVEARQNDYSRFEAALASGAQIISTDYYVADPTLGTGFEIRLPGDGFARCNPVLVSGSCSLQAD